MNNFGVDDQGLVDDDGLDWVKLEKGIRDFGRGCLYIRYVAPAKHSRHVDCSSVVTHRLVILALKLVTCV